MATTTVDQYGRTTASTNPDSKTTATAYTPATGAEPTTITVTDPARLVTTTKFDPLRDLPTTKTDPAAYVTTEQYDALGRLTAVYKPGQPAGPGEANLKYSYTVSNTGPSIVDTDTLLADDQTSSEVTYGRVETLYDSMLRAREVQTQTPDNTRTITDTVYNTNGQQSQTNDPYWNQAPVSTTLVQAQVGQVPSATGYLYDTSAVAPRCYVPPAQWSPHGLRPVHRLPVPAVRHGPGTHQPHSSASASETRKRMKRVEVVVKNRYLHRTFSRVMVFLGHTSLRGWRSCLATM
jgi:YD repeat-containing protein